MLKKLYFLIIIFFLIPVISVAEISKSICMDGKVQALKNGGFSGPILCGNQNATFKFLGKLTEKPNYLLYNYQYKFKPKNGSIYHGGQKLVLFNSSGC